MSSLSGPTPELTPEPTPDLTVAELVKLLGLRPHPEGGHYVETFRSLARVARAGAEARPDEVRAGSTAIYYLLAAGGEFME